MLKSQKVQASPYHFYFSDAVQMKFDPPLQNKNAPKGALFMICGGRGIRTPGPAIAGQRFSRPPHSTTLPFLLRAQKYNFFSLLAFEHLKLFLYLAIAEKNFNNFIDYPVDITV
jgi:hypothetical protein